MIPKLDSTQFTYQRYNAGGWIDLGIGYDDSFNNFKDKVKEYAIGYCDAKNLIIRPREGKAIMFDMQDGGEWFWLHLEDEFFNNIFNSE